MALGAAVGGALPRSRVEDRMFGEQSDQAMEKVRTLAEEKGAKLQATASAVVDEALDIADDVSAQLGSKLPSGEHIIDAVKAKAVEAADRLQEAATRRAGVRRRTIDLPDVSKGVRGARTCFDCAGSTIDASRPSPCILILQEKE